MAFADAETAIRAKIAAEWPRPTVPVLYENEVQVVPAPPFVLVHVSSVHEKLEAYGSPGNHEWCVYGNILAHVHVAMLSGLALARAIRDDFGVIFRGKRFSGLSCYGVTPLGSVERPDKGTTYVQAAVVNFTYRFKG